METLKDCQHALEAFVAYASLVEGQDIPIPRWGARAIGVLVGEVKRLQKATEKGPPADAVGEFNDGVRRMMEASIVRRDEEIKKLAAELVQKDQEITRLKAATAGVENWPEKPKGKKKAEG